MSHAPTMFDSRLRPLIDPPLNIVAAALDRTGLTANQMSLVGLALAGAAAGAVVLGWFALAFILIGLNRIADGLDGALARRHGATDLGGYYDIVFDFWFYGAIPLAFALHDPAANAIAAALLIASFYANGATFLAFSALAARRGLSTSAQGRKSIYYLAGLAEGFETIVVFLLMCAFPAAFFVFALAFAVICFLSAAVRTVEVAAHLADVEAAPASQGERGNTEP